MPLHTNGCSCGPGYATPLAAMRDGPREKILYVICIEPNWQNNGRQDYLATVDVDPQSPDYCKVVHRLKMPHPGDELHHFGWNACSSCHGDGAMRRDKLVLPAIGSDRIYIVDTADQKAPALFKVIEPEAMHALDISTPHTTHCLPSGEVMISIMGDPKGNSKGDFLLIDSAKWTIKGLWTKSEKKALFGYDFWYQPHWDVLISTEWSAPKSFKQGFIYEDTINPKITGRSLNVYSWSERKLLQTIDLGVDGITPLEIRFLHDPLAATGYVGCALNANVFRFFRKDDGSWDAEKVIDIPSKTVDGWALPQLSGMVTDILISLDDRFLYLSNWLHGDVRQYDITDRKHPQLTGQVFVGGSALRGGSVTVTKDLELESQPEPLIVKGRRVEGSAQMLQLSLDGKRLYVTTALFSPWDKQIYPEMVKTGSVILKMDVDTTNGGLTLDPDFLVDFGKEPGGPVLAHECRYPGGDCTSDIWLADTKQ